MLTRARRTMFLSAIAVLLTIVFLPAFAAESASAAARNCGLRVAESPLGGSGLVLMNLRVQAITCRFGERIAARTSVGRRPPGWKCRTSSTGRSVCRQGKRTVAWTFGGDAG